jgi:cation transport ATPase
MIITQNLIVQRRDLTNMQVIISDFQKILDYTGTFCPPCFHMIQQWLGFTIAFQGDKYVVGFGKYYLFLRWNAFFQRVFGEVKAGAIGMMTLVALAITVAYVYSVAVVFGLPGMDFFGIAINCDHASGSLARNAFDGSFKSVAISSCLTTK